MRWRSAALAGGVCLALFAGEAQADLLELRYRDASGADRQQVGSAQFSNPTGTVSAIVSAGVERRVAIELRTTDGATLASATSSVISATDRITVGGLDHYAKTLTFPAPPDGEYRLISRILAADGTTVIDEAIQAWSVDTSPPTAGCFELLGTWTGNRIAPCAGASAWVASSFEAQALKLHDLADASGIDEVKFTATRSGVVVRETAAKYDAASRSAQIGNGNAHSVNTTYFPDEDGEYKAMFTVVDKAGNRATFTQPLYWIAKGPGAEIVAVYDGRSDENFLPAAGPLFDGFKPYVAGVTSDTNPVKIVVRYPIEYAPGPSQPYPYKVGAYSGAVLTGTGETPDYVDGAWAYKIVSGSYRSGGWSGYAGINRSKHWLIGYLYYDIDLDPTAVQSPNITKVEVEWSDIGWTTSSRWLTSNTGPQTMVRARIQAEPRPYDQFAITSSPSAECTIPAGQTSCVMEIGYLWADPGNGYRRSDGGVTLATEDRLLSARGGSAFNVRMDMHAPEIVGWRYRQETDDLIVTLHETDTRYPAYVGSASHRVQIAFKRPDGEVAFESAEVLSTSVGDVVYEAVLPLSAAPDGAWNLVVRARDSVGNAAERTEDLILDREAPVVNILYGDVPYTGGMVQDFAQFSAQILDTNPIATASLRLRGGPANEDVVLPLVQAGERWVPEYPVLWPTTEDGRYVLSITATDADGHVGSSSVQFGFAPPQVDLIDAGDGLWLPGMVHAFQRPDGRWPFESALFVMSSGDPLSGIYGLRATLRSDSTIPVAVRGHIIAPGETVDLGAYDFGMAGGRIQLPVAAAEVGAGVAHLLLSTGAPGAPILVTTVRFWVPSVQLQGTASATQIVDQVSVSAVSLAGSRCQLTNSATVAAEADPLGEDATCLVEWETLPSGLAVTGSNGFTVAGRAAEAGDFAVSARISMFSGGSQIPWTTISAPLVIDPAAGAASWALDDLSSPILRTIERVETGVRQESGADCPLYLEADRLSARAVADRGQIACIWTWSTLPEGVRAVTRGSQPALEGTVGSVGEHEIGWSVSVLGPNGAETLIADQAASIMVQNPPAPELTLERRGDVVSGPQTVPAQGGYVGDLIATVPAGDLVVDVTYPDGATDTTTAAGTEWRETVARSRLNARAAPLLERALIKAKARYAALPEMETTLDIETFAVPPETVAPEIEVQSGNAVDTEPLPVRVFMRDSRNRDVVSPDYLGNWRIRLVNVVSRTESVPLTDYVEVAGGAEAAFALDLATVSTSTLRVGAEAELIVPDGLPTARVMSTRGISVAIVNGSPVDGAVEGRNLSGEAPLSAAFSLSVSADMARAAGDVSWEVSTDGGQAWELIPNAKGRRLSRRFDAGDYFVRARITNRWSGVATSTEYVAVHAYPALDIEVDGPSRVFAGESVTLKPSMKDGAATDVQVRWSLDRGKSWIDGASIEITREEATRLNVLMEARSGDAGTADDLAWKRRSHSLSFLRVTGPRVRLSVPSYPEAGRAYTLKATLSVAYAEFRDRLRGQFTLPDGTVVDGLEASWTPSVADLATTPVVTYTAWIDGKPGTETRMSRQIRVWQYVWPDLSLRVQQRVPYAPSTVTVSVVSSKSVRTLDDFQTQWELPPGVRVVRAYSTQQMIEIPAAGTYPIKVVATDARGNRAELETVIIAERPPEIALDIELRPMTKYFRAPYEVLIKPKVAGGHPRDRVEDYSFAINGSTVDDRGSYATVTLDAGVTAVEVVATTRYGWTVTKAVEVSVPPNQAPVCTLNAVEASRAVIYRAECTDEDGYIAGYRWLLDGVERRGGPLLSVTDTTTADLIEVYALDDAGVASNVVSATRTRGR